MSDNQLSYPQHIGSGQHSKVPIPRLTSTFDPSVASPEKHRVVKACTNCRRRKVKCTGEFPRCKNCDESDTPCIYEQLRKDRLKMAMEQNQALITLLKDLSFRSNEEDQRMIHATLDAVGPRCSELAMMTNSIKVDDDAAVPSASNLGKTSTKRPRKASPITEEMDEAPTIGEAHAPASVGSTEDIDLLDEDLLRSRESRETGFVGQNSEIQWLRSFQRQMGNTENEPYGMPYGPPGTSDDAQTKRTSAMYERRKASTHGNIQHVVDSSFYLDSESLEVETLLDPYELPPPEIAETLFACYIDTVHTSFPILPQTFVEQFYKYMDSVKRQQQFRVPERWQAMLNLVFAIGAQYSHLTNANWREDSRDHLLYMTRAVRILGVKDTTMIISAPDLELIQATGLLSFYYLVIGHVSRAWIMVGISLRFALAVGLHLRNEDPSAPANKKEILGRTWWSLISIECLSSSITGRPCIIANEDCTVPLPQMLPEERSHRMSSPGQTSRIPHGFMTNPEISSLSSSLSAEPVGRMEGTVIASQFLEAHIKITLTTRKVLKGLYAAGTASSSWERIQKTIASLRAELDQWATAALPNGAGAPNLNLHHGSDRSELLLGFHYHSIKILMTRPCLCRLERRIQGQSDSSSSFNQRMAEDCIQAAQHLTLLLPDQPDAAFIYQKGPWWSIVHIIMQAMAVFLLEMLYQGTHLSMRDNEAIPKSIKKLLRWLRSMQLTNAVAGRAYKLVRNILKSDENRVPVDVTDLLSEDEADTDQGHFFNIYPSADLAADPGMFATNEWQSDLFDTAPFQPMVNPYFLPDEFPLPVLHGNNTFLTSFDQENPISVSMYELWRSRNNMSPTYPFGDSEQQPLE